MNRIKLSRLFKKRKKGLWKVFFVAVGSDHEKVFAGSFLRMVRGSKKGPKLFRKPGRDDFGFFRMLEVFKTF